MSLVIASNEILDTSIKNSQFQSAYSWSNHLDQPLKIKPNSEVAVQSLKVNKDGTISINPSTIWYVYFGVKLADGSVSLDNTTSAIHIADLGVTGSSEVSVETLAEKIQDGLNRAVPTPETFGLAKCEVVRNASGTDFQGFKFEFSSRGDGSGLNNIPQTWNSIYQRNFGSGVGLTFNSASNTLTPIAQYVDRNGKAFYNIAIGEDTPLALNGGEYTVDLTNAGKTAWAVGLRRCSGNQSATPEIYDYTSSELGYAEHFSDFVVYSVQDRIGVQNNQFKIRVYQSAYDSSKTLNDDKPITMREVDYTQGNGSFSSIYNWTTNASNDNYTKIRFNVDNEKIRVHLVNASGSDLLVASTGDKGERFNPVRDTCRNLYPMAFCTNNASNNSFLTIDKWSGREITGFSYANAGNDWWAYTVQNDLERKLAIPVETRPFLDMSTDTAHTYKGVNASGVFVDYDYAMVLRPSNLYTDSGRANADTLFGFNEVVVLDNATKSGSNNEISTYISSQSPLMKSTTSIFVRLNNLPVKSYNAGQSRRSQIIYSAPRFSTGTEQSVGALYFESPEKTYISLDNPNEINLNTIDIDLVNENETLAKDLLGKSVCVLHIREKKG